MPGLVCKPNDPDMKRPLFFSHGFTLIESLVALSILAIALTAVSKAAGNMNVQQAELLRRLEAQWSAENVATTVRISHSFPVAGTQIVSCPQGRAPLVCTLVVENTPNPNFRKINIKVSEPAANGAAGAQLSTMVMYVGNIP